MKFIDEVLSEIIGVPCGNIKFELSVESIGQTLGKYYHNGIQKATIEFSCKERINSDVIGSVYIYPVGAVVRSRVQSEYFYKAVLVQGKETDKIAQAVVDGLSKI